MAIAACASVAAGGCATGRPPAAPPSDEPAILLSADDAFVERIDDAKAALGFKVLPGKLAPGRHTVILRRRIEVDSRMGPRFQATYPYVLGEGPMGKEALFSESKCAVTFEARPGATYTARTIETSDEEAWRGSIVGDGVDVSCIAADAIPDELVGQTRYLCCTTVFAADEATDANYRYADPGARWLPAGTPVHVTDARRNSIGFRTEDGGPVYWLYLEYGNDRIEAPAYFDTVLRERDPVAALTTAPSVKRAIAAGRLLPGMTRDEAILARGYPPLHQTESLESNQWTYYESPLSCDYVTFTDGIIETVRRGPSP
jgi:hypothetical protein